jgi:hypothetical protein
LKLLDKFKGLAFIQIKDGASCLFWDDCWVGQPLKLSFPELPSFAKKTVISFKSVLAMSPPSGLFNSPISLGFCSILRVARNPAELSAQPLIGGANLSYEAKCGHKY